CLLTPNLALPFAPSWLFDTINREMKQNCLWTGAFLTIMFAMCAQEQSESPATADFDVIIKGGTVYDGTGTEPRQADVAIRGDRIAGVGDFKAAKAKTVIDAKGLAVA